MDDIKKDLEELKLKRGVQRSKREKSGIPVVALVGYTNSGKSSLMNCFLSMEDREDKQVFEKNMLFATLDTSQRLITLDDNKSFILVDTVGFVDKLPHSLVNAFKATLEEVSKADLLVHVVDCGFEKPDFHIDVTRKVLKELGAENKTELLVFNKSDLYPDFDAIDYPASLKTSAKTGEGIDRLIEAVKSEIFSDIEVVELLIPFNRGDVVSAIVSKSKPMETKYLENGTYLKVELNSEERGRWQSFIQQ